MAAQRLCREWDNFLPCGEAMAIARRWQMELQRDRTRSRKDASPLANEDVYRAGGGKMLGVLVAVDPRSHQRLVLRAFSGQVDRSWVLEGWALPVFDVDRWHALESRYEPEIQATTRQLAKLSRNDSTRRELVARRKIMSRELFSRYLSLYQLRSFSGQWQNIAALWPDRVPPTGAGDCCAPKLLQAASLRGLSPISLAEFYWGASNRSRTRSHGAFYRPCREKCEPILRFMLEDRIGPRAGENCG